MLAVWPHSTLQPHQHITLFYMAVSHCQGYALRLFIPTEAACQRIHRRFRVDFGDTGKNSSVSIEVGTGECDCVIAWHMPKIQRHPTDVALRECTPAVSTTP